MRRSQFDTSGRPENNGRSLQKLCETWIIKSWHWSLFWLNQTTRESVNWHPSKSIAIYKGYNDVLGKVVKACEIDYYVKPWRFRRCRGSRKQGRCIHQIWRRLFNSFMTEFYWENDTRDVCAYQDVSRAPWMPESGFTPHQIMHLHINFCKVALTGGSYYNELTEWIAIKKRSDESKK